MFNIVSKIKEKHNNYLINNCIGEKKNINLCDLLHFWIRNNEFIRLDIIAYYLEYESSYHDCANYKPLLKKMLGISGDSLLNDSIILVDRKYNLISGSRKIAECLFNGERNIEIKIVDIDYHKDYSKGWFIENDFSHEEINLLLKKSNELIEDILKISFACIVWSNAKDYISDIKEDINYYSEIEDCQLFSFDDGEYETIVKKIYDIDDIEEWKVNKKIEHLRNKGNVLFLINMKNCPNYRIKAKTKMPISTSSERIKKAIRRKYSKKIDSYYYDVIIHIADNSIQSEYINKLLLKND